MWRRGLVRSRTEAAQLVEAGRVLVAGQVSRTRSTNVGEKDPIEVTPGDRFVGRGGFKLAGALDSFGIDPAGLTVLDVGASTGGFTDCLLQRGAAAVVAVDVGTNQMAEALRNDPRVMVLENTDIRQVTDGSYPLVVADVSFISVVDLAPTLAGFVRSPGSLLVLVKPQFEVGRGRVGRGVVNKPEIREQAIRRAEEALRASGLEIAGAIDSDLAGEHGNREHFLWAAKT